LQCDYFFSKIRGLSEDFWSVFFPSRLKVGAGLKKYVVSETCVNVLDIYSTASSAAVPRQGCKCPWGTIDWRLRAFADGGMSRTGDSLIIKVAAVRRTLE
jgi:hypothetical protein